MQPPPTEKHTYVITYLYIRDTEHNTRDMNNLFEIKGLLQVSSLSIKILTNDCILYFFLNLSYLF